MSKAGSVAQAAAKRADKAAEAASDEARREEEAERRAAKVAADTEAALEELKRLVVTPEQRRAALERRCGASLTVLRPATEPPPQRAGAGGPPRS